MEVLIILTITLIIGMIIYRISPPEPIFMMGAMFVLGSSLLLPVFGIGYIWSYKEVSYINKKYNTNYTTQDHFWHSKYIESDLKINDNIVDNNSRIRIINE